MLELTRNITFSRVPHPRAATPLLAGLVVAIAIVALLTLGGHGGHGGHGVTQASTGHQGTSAPAPTPASVVRASKRACASDSSATGAPGATSAATARHPALDSALTAALRTVRARLYAPAATAAVVVCGRVVWAGATGILDVGSSRPATNQSLFILNSAAKTFVATMVMQEIQAGHLALDTKLAEFYPALPNAQLITVRNLLNMTSGLRDYLYNPRVEAMMDRQPRHHWTIDQVLTALGSGLGTPRFAPGRGFQYSDTNYIVLGGILQHVTHSSIQRDLQRLIGRPLGITSATFVPTPAAKSLIAHPYQLSRDGSFIGRWIPGYGVPSAVWGPVFTDGGLAASSLDVARFANALFAGRLVNATGLQQMVHIGTGDYGFGLRSRSSDGHYWLGHRGYFGGFEAEDWTDPSRQVTIAVGANLQAAGGVPTSTRIWTAIEQAYDRQSAAAG